MIFNPTPTVQDIPNFTIPQQVNNSGNSTTSNSGPMTGSEFLKELRSKFKQVNISVGNITPNNSANAAFGGTGLHNISVSDKYLEEMASSPEKQAEFTKKVSDIISLDKQYKSATEADGGKLISHGIIIDSEGGMRGWSHTTQSSEGGNTISSKATSSRKKSYSDNLKELNEKRKERQKTKELREKRLEQNRAHAEKLYEKLKENRESNNSTLQPEPKLLDKLA